MKIDPKNIEIFKDFSEIQFGEFQYDFHNNFDCIGITFKDKVLNLNLRNTTENYDFSLKFEDVDIVNFEFFLEIKSLTIDTLYKGRFVFNEQLIEISIDERCYFYLEFYEGPKFEFFSRNIVLEKI